MSDLPSGWEWTTLGEIAESVANGIFVSRASAEPAGVPILRISAVRPGQLDLSDLRYSRLSSAELRGRGALLEPGDLLFTRYSGSPDYVGVCAAVPDDLGDLTYPDKLIRIRLPPNVSSRFMELAIRSPRVRAEIEARHRTTAGQVGISGSALKTVPVPLPPLAEQRRIVLEFDELQEQIAQGERLLHSSLSRLRRQQSGTIKRALYGRRGPDSRYIQPEDATSAVDDGDLPPLPPSWSWRRLGSIAELVGGITKDLSKQSDPSVSLVPYLRVANVQRGALDLDCVTTIRASPRQIDKLRLRAGDVLLNEGGDRDKLGRGWVWEGQIEDCIHQNHVFRARINDEILDPRLLAWHANNFGLWFERNGKQSVNLASISLTTIKQLPVPVPPRDKQDAIVRTIEAEVDNASHLRASLISATDRARQLRSAILGKAFVGRLVSQDPADEPASMLLDRIRTERATATGPRRRRRASTVGR